MYNPRMADLFRFEQNKSNKSVEFMAIKRLNI